MLGKLCVITMNNDAKFEEEMTYRFEIEMRNLTNVDRALECLKNMHFNGLFFIKVYNI